MPGYLQLLYLCLVSSACSNLATGWHSFHTFMRIDHWTKFLSCLLWLWYCNLWIPYRICLYSKPLGLRSCGKSLISIISTLCVVCTVVNMHLVQSMLMSWKWSEAYGKKRKSIDLGVAWCLLVCSATQVWLRLNPNNAGLGWKLCGQSVNYAKSVGVEHQVDSTGVEPKHCSPCVILVVWFETCGTFGTHSYFSLK